MHIRPILSTLLRHRTTATLIILEIALTFALAIISSVLAGIIPAWRGCQITPAIQLKSH